MDAVQTRITVEEFENIVSLPENADKKLEFWDGEIVEVVTNNYASIITMRIASRIAVYVEQNNLGFVTSSDGGYIVSGNRYIPDIGFISSVRQPQPSHEAYNPLAPDLAVEIVSPTDLPRNITKKTVNYLSAGTTVWIIYPEDKQAEVYEHGQPVRTFTIEDALEGGRVLPGFTLALKDILKEK